MFTIDDIKAAHSKVKSGSDFPQYIQDLKSMGVTIYETYVSDGHTDYYGENNYKATAPARYGTLNIATESDAAGFSTGLKDHQQGKTDYPSFCKMSAETGVEKWIVSIKDMTCIYFDQNGKELLTENIPG